jgi:hypothetical protein
VSDVSDFTHDSALPDLDTEAVRRLMRDPPLSKETIYRLGRAGAIEGYLLAGCRVWRRASVYAYIERQRALGAQFAPAVKRRRPGRPRKHPKPEAAASAAE